MKKIFLLIGLLGLVLLSGQARAMSVEHVTDYNVYTPQSWSAALIGYPIDDSTSGVSFYLPTAYANLTSLDLNSPDGTTHQWVAWVRMIDSSLAGNCTAQLCSNVDPHPPDIDVRIQCGLSGGIFHVSSNNSNDTWNSGYTLFALTFDTEEMNIYAEREKSPTGKDLWILQRICNIEVYPDQIPAGEVVEVSVWNVNPSKAAMCGSDPAVQFIQSSVAGIVNINIQVWEIAFQIFTIVVIIGSIFGLPLFVLKLIRWTMSELKGKKRI
jgi:hypothetical protein